MKKTVIYSKPPKYYVSMNFFFFFLLSSEHLTVFNQVDLSSDQTFCTDLHCLQKCLEADVKAKKASGTRFLRKFKTKYVMVKFIFELRRLKI